MSPAIPAAGTRRRALPTPPPQVKSILTFAARGFALDRRAANAPRSSARSTKIYCGAVETAH